MQQIIIVTDLDGMLLDGAYPAITRGNGYHVIRPGAPYPELRKALEDLQKEGYA